MDDLSIHRLDVDGALAEAAEPLGGVSRAGFLGASMSGSLAMLGLRPCRRTLARAPRIWTSSTTHSPSSTCRRPSTPS